MLGRFNSVFHSKILDWSKFKELKDDKIKMTEKLKIVSGRIENMGKGEYAVFQQFVLLPL